MSAEARRPGPTMGAPEVEASRERLLAAIGPTADLVFVRAWGNLGDELIYAGTRQLLADRPYREVNIRALEGVRGHTALLAGGGGWCRTYHGLARFLPELEARFERVIMLPSSFDTAEPSVRAALAGTKAKVFAREETSYAQIRGLCDAGLAHDCAFFFDFGPYQRQGEGVLNAFRTDPEAAGGALPAGNIDLSRACSSLDEWLWAIARHAVVRSDRAHVVIAAALLGKTVEYRASNYHKVPAIVAYGLPGYPVTALPPEPDGHGPAAPDLAAEAPAAQPAARVDPAEGLRAELEQSRQALAAATAELEAMRRGKVWRLQALYWQARWQWQTAPSRASEALRARAAAARRRRRQRSQAPRGAKAAMPRPRQRPAEALRGAVKAAVPPAARQALRGWLGQLRDLARRAGPISTGPAKASAAPVEVLRLPPGRGYDILCFPIIDWGFRFQRPQQLLTQFARDGRRCFYLDMAFRANSRAAQVRRLAEGVFGVGLPGPSGMSPYKGEIGDADAEAMLAALDELRTTAGLTDVVALVQLPFWTPLALAARERWGWKVVYDCLDEHSGFTNMAAAVAGREAQLIAESDLTLATSEGLLAKVAPTARQTVLVKNAADYEHFSQKPEAQPLAGLAGPVIGYYGAIADWFDVDLLHGAALARPDWQFVLIGHTFGADLSVLALLPNVHLLGEKPYAELPAYLHGFDVACIPFKLNPLTQATNPVKFYEYMSAGKPVVSVRLPELNPHRDLYYPADTAEEFVAQCEAALREDSAERAAARRACGQANTWAHRHASVRSALPRLFGRAAVIIVSYGGREHLAQCLDSVFERTDYPHYSVVVVDNGSGPEVTDYLRERAASEPRLQLVLNESNHGFARANNQGVQAAGPCEYVVLLNNDTIVTTGWLSKLVDYLRHPQVGLVGPVTNATGNEAKVDIGPYALADLDAAAAAYTRAHAGQVFDIPVLAMFCVAMRRQLLDEIGLLDERFGVGLFEDDDFALRVRRAGYRVICANDIFVHHWMRAAFKQMPAEAYEALFAANKAQYEQKWGVTWEPHRHRARRAIEPKQLANNEIAWRCNICGSGNQTPLTGLGRENASCTTCRSSVRMRSIIHLLAQALFGESLTLPDFPERLDLRGAGLSDWEVYADPLRRKLGYTNTYYHKAPRLDITDIDPALAGTLDFLIASDVFEHVAPPVARAFENARRLLKPDGVLIFSVPYSLDAETVEHFPELHKFGLIELEGQPALRNVTADGREQVFQRLAFHGGPGATLEMRLFSEAGLRSSLAAAGFARICVHGEPYFEHGVYWKQPWSLPLVARPK